MQRWIMVGGLLATLAWSGMASAQSFVLLGTQSMQLETSRGATFDLPGLRLMAGRYDDHGDTTHRIYYKGLFMWENDSGVRQSANFNGLGYDVIFNVHRQVRPYVGGSLGYAQYRYSDSFGSDSGAGLAAGYQLGVDFSVNDYLSIDLGYEYIATELPLDQYKINNFTAFGFMLILKF
ncbi:MAG: outer membrane beta-barrel protein [Thiomicrospira sp.]|uniref:outer membrane protein n=1 Tax=Thiomicrospira sp. TaxID=935 RepID=UPI0019EC9779|nr:outer membrane beta-barrel protein [Thiomicrospira sp.]MBE0494109.1 outer membrane beta-barrel protein [Thiomicrospira sp.]